MAEDTSPNDDILKEIDPEQSRIAMLCNAQTEDGRPAYLYMLMSPSQYVRYFEAVEKGDFINFEEYGEILAIGEGETPPPEVQKEMEEEFNVDHDFMENLQKELRALSEEYQRMQKRGVSDEQFFRQKAKALVEELEKQKNDSDE